MSEALDRLADLAGIEASFRDYFGNETAVSDATKRALLGAMGYDAASEAGIDAALCDAEDEPWKRVLARGAIFRIGDPLQLACSLPARGDDELSWEIGLEDGTSLGGVLAWNGAANAGIRIVGARRLERRRVTIDALVPLGYHRMTVRARGVEGSAALTIVPEACYVPPDLERGTRWALATGLYALRSDRDWGAGDFGSLSALTEVAAQAGAMAIALNPLHELHPGNPKAASPYAPSSRFFLNALYVDVNAVSDLAESPEAQARVDDPAFREAIRGLRARELIDYEGVSTAKRGVLELLYRAFCANHLERPGDRRAASFRAFVRAGGLQLERLAGYEALDEFFRAAGAGSSGWLEWPPAFRCATSEAVARFARDHRARIEFHLYLQWLADEQLARAAATGRERGVVLYRDLAVGVDLNGADAWSDP
ncbi:MAG TPA: 4-alpha-glucanotransferase, partial [Candidatus Tumulicola sp.]